MKTSNKLLSAVLTIALGILFIILKSDVVSIAMTLLGVALIISGVIDLLHKLIAPGIVKAVIGVAVIVFGWTLMSIAIYIMAALILAFGVVQLVQAIKEKQNNTMKKLLSFIEPALMVIVACCLLFNQGGTIAWVFIVAGVVLIIEGVIALIGCLKDKN